MTNFVTSRPHFFATAGSITRKSHKTYVNIRTLWSRYISDCTVNITSVLITRMRYFVLRRLAAVFLDVGWKF